MKCAHLNPTFDLDRTSNVRPGNPDRPAPSLYVRRCSECGAVVNITPVHVPVVVFDGTACLFVD